MLVGSNLEASGGGLLKALRSAAQKRREDFKISSLKKTKQKKTTGLGLVVSLIPTSVGGGQQRPLAELLGDPQQASAEVGGGRGVMAEGGQAEGGGQVEEGGQAQQAGRLTQALEVLGILGQPRAEHGAHDPAVVGAENINTGAPAAPAGSLPLVQLQRQNVGSPLVTRHLSEILRFELINNAASSARISFFF